MGIRFLASEYSTGNIHRGRIDTLGIDENGCPVIIEYKRALNENVINQGLFYLNWLMDHKGEFELCVLKKLGNKSSEEITWNNPRLICIAGNFTKYDENAVQQMNRNIELIRYRRFGDELLLFELMNAASADIENDKQSVRSGQKNYVYKTVGEMLESSPTDLKDIFQALRAFLLALGDDVQERQMKFYFAFKRIKNFACVEVHPQTKKLLVYVKVDPTHIDLESNFTRDVREIGHYGTGDLEITIRSLQDVERAKYLLERSYDAS
jgi:predicted transport protein